MRDEKTTGKTQKTQSQWTASLEQQSYLLKMLAAAAKENPKVIHSSASRSWQLSYGYQSKQLGCISFQLRYLTPGRQAKMINNILDIKD